MAQGLTTGGWLFMIITWSLIIGFAIVCFVKVLAKHREKQGVPIHLAAGGREQWASRIGLILAVAGNAIGLGNFLRFPVQAAKNGGGAFMIPYFCALIFLGIPLMWVEWSIGRMGGVHGHGTTPGMLQLLWKNRAAKYLGALGIAFPFIIVVYYTYIESWTLAFSWFSATGKYFGNTTREAMGQFLRGFQGVEHNSFFPTVLPMLIFLFITLVCNYYFLYKGISKGIELLAKIGMPVLFAFGIALAIRVLGVGTPDPALPAQNIANGLGYIWNPDFSRLSQASVWLAAAGQIFFTLSLGTGVIHVYASYLKKNDDVTLNGLTTSVTNEFAEVVLGGTIAIPVAVAFFGQVQTQAIAEAGAFDLGFQSLPVIFQKLPLGQFFGAMWFLLLFIAGITSSVALLSPAIAFFEDEFKWKRPKAVNAVFLILLSCIALVVIFLKYGFLDELDFWAGTFGLVFFATIEIILFSWVYGVKKGWKDIHVGADLKLPGIFKFILKYITPVYMIGVLVIWIIQEAIGKGKFLMKGEEASRHPYLWGARLLYAGIIVLAIILVGLAWNQKKKGFSKKSS